MSPRALAGSRGALLLLGAASVVASCSLWPGHSDDPGPAPTPSAAPTSQAEGGNGGAAPSTAPAPKKATVHVTLGQLGTGCSVKNDCEVGLSCVRGLCEKVSFGLAPTGKECVQTDCKTSADCCAGLPSDIPEKCRSRAASCTKDLPGCEAKACTRSSECAGGGICSGHCLISSGECSGNGDCLANKCIGGSCSINFTTCNSDAECSPNTCGGGNCACANPAYMPTQPVCSDPDCDDLCLWECESSRCVIPTICTTDDDCFGAKPLCVKGECVECVDSTDCAIDKICRKGSCEGSCQNDSNCALFETCRTGECVYVGCRSDRECALISDVNALELEPGFDPRLLRCHTEAGVGKCLIPCEDDSQCGSTETCADGVCRYIGCENNDECKSILGVHDRVASELVPWIPVVECRAVEDAP